MTTRPCNAWPSGSTPVRVGGSMPCSPATATRVDKAEMVGKRLTVREIATRLKVSKTALYEAFRTEPP